MSSTAQPIALEHLVQKPTHAALLIGDAFTAGHLLKFQQQAAPFCLRIQTAIAVPTHLGEFESAIPLHPQYGRPLLLDRIEAGAILGAQLDRVEAKYCGSATPLQVIRADGSGATVLPNLVPTPLKSLDSSKGLCFKLTASYATQSSQLSPTPTSEPSLPITIGKPDLQDEQK